jgi:hypothetical protein
MRHSKAHHHAAQQAASQCGTVTAGLNTTRHRTHDTAGLIATRHCRPHHHAAKHASSPRGIRPTEACCAASGRRKRRLYVSPPPRHRARHSATPAPSASLCRRRPGTVLVIPPPRPRARHSAAPTPCASLRRPGTMRVTLPPWHRARHTAAPADEVQDCFNKLSFYSEDLSIKRSGMRLFKAAHQIGLLAKRREGTESLLRPSSIIRKYTQSKPVEIVKRPYRLRTSRAMPPLTRKL